jgi:hypothetical protein
MAHLSQTATAVSAYPSLIAAGDQMRSQEACEDIQHRVNCVANKTTITCM